MTRIDARRAILALTLTLAFGPAASAPGADLADELLRLVPADAGLTLVVADLRGHARTIADSALAKAIGGLPAVRSWRDSEAGRRFEQARDWIEQAAGAPIEAIRDELLGDAVVLSLHVPRDARPDAARGLLLIRARDRALMARMIDLGNEAGGAVASEVGEGDRRYNARRFPGTEKGDEFYRLLDDGTFLWSNAEPLIRAALDRRDGVGAGLADDPGFRSVRRGLPDRSLAVVHINPAFAAKALASGPKSGKPGDDRMAEWLIRASKSLRGIGLALEWRDGPRLHAHEVFDPKGIAPGLLPLAKAPATPDDLARRVPRTALAVASATIDLGAVSDALIGLVPAGERPRLDAVLGVLRGLLLGRDPRADILARLGPSAVAYVEEPAGDSSRMPMVAAVAIRDEAGGAVAASLDNALRTLLCLVSLDPKRGASPPRIETRQVGATRVTSLGGLGGPFAFGVGADCLVVGDSADAVARFGASGSDARLAAIRAAEFLDARASAAVDVTRLARSARAHRADFARRYAEARGVSAEAASRDLDQALVLLDLFDAAFLALTVDPGLTWTHQTLGLIAR